MEMELQIRELEEKDSNLDNKKLTADTLKQLDNQNKSDVSENGNNKSKSSVAAISHKFEATTEKNEVISNGHLNRNLKQDMEPPRPKVEDSVGPPTPPPSPPADDIPPKDLQSSLANNSSNKENVKNDKMRPRINDVNSAKNNQNTLNNGSSNPLNFSIQPYGTYDSSSPAKKIQTKVWEPSPRKPVITTSAKAAVLLSSKPLNTEMEFIEISNASHSFVNKSTKSKDTTVSSASGKSAGKTAEISGKSAVKTIDSVIRGMSSLSSSSNGSFSPSKSFSSSVFNKKQQSTAPTYVSEEQPSPPPLDEVYKQRSLKDELAESTNKTVSVFKDIVNKFDIYISSSANLSINFVD